MKKMGWYRNQGLKLLVAFITISVYGFQLQAQDECVSFGWANFDGQSETGPVTGGGESTPVEVTSFSALKSAVESSESKVIHVMNDMGNGYRGRTGDVLNFKSNKTVIGMKPEITVKCSFQISGAHNIIIQNLILRGPGNTNSEQNWDAVTIQQGAKRVWFDHCTVMDGEDGNFDVVKGADNVTASWCKFTYASAGAHNFSNLVGSSNNEPQSHGKLNITYAYCWWENVNSRCPRTRYGKIHVLNCYYNNVGSGVYAGKMSNIRLEGSYFENNVKNPTGLISTDGEAGVFSIDCNRGETKKDGYATVFEPPYTYEKYDHSEVKSMVREQAGATLTDPTQCGATGVTAEIHHNIKCISSFSVKGNEKVRVDLNLRQGEEVRIDVLDLSGRTIVAARSTNTYTGSTNTTFDLRGVRSGVYILNVSTGDRIMTRRIIKN